MFNINRNSNDIETKKSDAKTNPGSSISTLFPVFKQSIWNLIDTVSNFSAYEMAHWSNNLDRWIHNRSYQNTASYRRGSILFVDLGASNYSYEPSFTHPCIVLVNKYNMILVVPCSSQKYGKGYPEIIDATSSDGFSKDTGIQMDSLRWIHKNRVISPLGHAGSAVLTKIDNYILNQIPFYRLEKQRTLGLLSDKDDKITTQSQQINDLEEKIEKINEQIREKGLENELSGFL